MKFCNKRSIICIFIVLLILFVPIISYSKSTFTGTVNPNTYKPSVNDVKNAGKLQSKAEVIVSAVRIFGVIVAVISLSVIGIRYMLGSTEEKAEYKQTMIPYFIGIALVVAVTVIPSIIFNFSKSVNK